MNVQEMVGWALFALGLVFSLVPTGWEAVQKRSLSWMAVAPAMFLFWYEALMALFWGCAIASLGSFFPAAVWLTKAAAIPWQHILSLIS